MSSTIRIGISADNIATVSCLLNVKSLIVICATECLAPLLGTTRISFYEQCRRIARAIGCDIFPACKNIPPIRGLLNRMCTVVIYAPECLTPLLVTIRIGFYEPCVIISTAVGLCIASNYIAPISGLLNREKSVHHASYPKALAPLLVSTCIGFLENGYIECSLTACKNIPPI